MSGVLFKISTKWFPLFHTLVSFVGVYKYSYVNVQRRRSIFHPGSLLSPYSVFHWPSNFQSIFVLNKYAIILKEFSCSLSIRLAMNFINFVDEPWYHVFKKIKLIYFIDNKFLFWRYKFIGWQISRKATRWIGCVFFSWPFQPCWGWRLRGDGSCSSTSYGYVIHTRERKARKRVAARCRCYLVCGIGPGDCRVGSVDREIVARGCEKVR